LTKEVDQRACGLKERRLARKKERRRQREGKEIERDISSQGRLASPAAEAGRHLPWRF
jgi:hypothetical protein